MDEKLKAIAEAIHSRNMAILAILGELDDLCLSLDSEHIPLVLNRQKTHTRNLPKNRNPWEIFSELCDKAQDFTQLTAASDWLHRPKQYAAIQELPDLAGCIARKMEEASKRLKKQDV
jgi:hypothetical protein